MNKLKKVFLSSVILLLSINLFSMDFEFLAEPSYSFPLGSPYNNLPGVNAGVLFSPLRLRKSDMPFISGNGGFRMLSGPGVSGIRLITADLGIGYDFSVIDRLSVGAEVDAGIWMTSGTEQTNFDSASGILVSGKFYTDYHISPSMAAGAYVAFRDYIYKPQPLLKNLEVGLRLKYNFSRGIFGKSNVSMNQDYTVAQPLFPVFYSRYADHDFGSVQFENKELNDIKDVTVQLFIEQFMSNPSVVASYPVVKYGENFNADLTAFLNENIMNNINPSQTEGKIIVNYKSLGKEYETEDVVQFTALSRNSMTWDDTRKAAAFVSSHDATAALFAKQVKSVVKNSLKPEVSENIQYAAALFGALKAYGIHYVTDPSSAFTDNINSDSVDFLKFPYQTLLYHGGDCDDLSILNCALLEALGIRTAFITIPNHIYMAFDSGYSVEDAFKISGNMYVIQDDTVWIPLEITLCQDSFELELRTGFREWIKYANNDGEKSTLIPLREAWKEYKSVGVSESDERIEMPSKARILEEFGEALK